ncbi:MAG: Cytochrome b6-f complex iron-sulfur subunit [Ignavibacteria bacterium]|nr:Cytochrome b6-f complex iron-sulfur subunit [Ignavibacteria bacterium]
MEKENFNRRDFIKSSIKTLTVGGLALSALDLKKLFAEAESKSPGGITKVINLSDYPDLGSVGGYVTIGKVIVIRKSESNFLALSLKCTHKKCDVEYNGSSFECPCHGSTYDGNGKVTNGPSTKNLKSYKTTFNSEENTLTINM